jgi:sulfate adenylyltransferase large subunit
MATQFTQPACEFQQTAGLLASSRNLLRFSTAGSVDDGKSTLIGRLLYDSQAVFEDQLASVRSSKINRSSGSIDFSLFTDGLRAECEQGITIDVAYRYFSSARRKFIIADTPGHEQYTRNMATGASTADAAVIVLDATKGVLRQSRRHAYIASLLGVPHLIAAVNKMDLVRFSREVFDRIAAEFREFTARLNIGSVYAVPVSALDGDNVVIRSHRTPWFSGPALLEYLETLPSSVGGLAANSPLRLPIQYVIRPNASFRGFAGQIASGMLRPGTTVVALPSGVKTRVKSIVTFAGELDTAGSGTSVNVTLEDEIDLSRGDVLVDTAEPPSTGRDFRATLVWMHADPLDVRETYLLKHTTRTVRATVKQLRHRVDVNTLARLPASSLDLNEIAEAELQTSVPLFFDPYRENRVTGSFILIDPYTNATVAAGTIEQASHFSSVPRSSPTSRLGHITEEERALRVGHPAAGVWLPEQPLVAERLERLLFDDGWHVCFLGSQHFLAHELVPAAMACALSGGIAIFSPTGESAAQTDAVRAIFRPDAFFTFPEVVEPTEEAALRIRDQLHVWRDTRSGAPRSN